MATKNSLSSHFHRYERGEIALGAATVAEMRARFSLLDKRYRVKRMNTRELKEALAVSAGGFIS